MASYGKCVSSSSSHLIFRILLSPAHICEIVEKALDHADHHYNLEMSKLLLLLLLLLLWLLLLLIVLQ
jgi:hypothetical protein